MADARDLKSRVRKGRAGSSPASAISSREPVQNAMLSRADRLLFQQPFSSSCSLIITRLSIQSEPPLCQLSGRFSACLNVIDTVESHILCIEPISVFESAGMIQLKL